MPAEGMARYTCSFLNRVELCMPVYVDQIDIFASVGCLNQLLSSLSVQCIATADYF
jgi:hypothetical protein